jgi:hypothetical protein
MIAPLRNNKIVLYDIIYASFSGFIFILLSSRSLEHKNSNEKGGWNGYENKGYKEPERCNLARIDNQGQLATLDYKNTGQRRKRDIKFSAHDTFLN